GDGDGGVGGLVLTEQVQLYDRPFTPCGAHLDARPAVAIRSDLAGFVSVDEVPAQLLQRRPALAAHVLDHLSRLGGKNSADGRPVRLDDPRFFPGDAR